MKKILPKIVSLFLALFLLAGSFSMSSPITVNAAANKAIAIKATFNGKAGDDSWIANSYFVAAQYKKSAKVSNKYQLSVTVYLPKSVLAKTDAAIHILPSLDLFHTKNDSYAGTILSRYTAIVYNNGKKVKLDGWDEVKSKSCQISKYAKLTSYNSKYYKLVFTTPVQSKMVNANGKAAKIKTGTKYTLIQNTSITGQGTVPQKASIYTDDLKIVSGQKTLLKITFNSKDYVYQTASSVDKLISSKVTAIK